MYRIIQNNNNEVINIVSDTIQNLQDGLDYRIQNIKKKLQIQGTLVPKLTLGPFLTLSVRNGHKLKDLGFRIPAYIESKSR